MRRSLLILFLIVCACVTMRANDGHAIEQRDGYTIERVQVSGHAAYLLCPETCGNRGKRGGCPAVVALHDHGAWFTIGKEKLTMPIWNAEMDSASNIALREESKRWMDKCFEGQAVADSLAKAGYVVLVTDALYWGERLPMKAAPLPYDKKKALNKELKNYQDTFYNALLEKDTVWFEAILRDDMEAVSYLASLPQVDAERIYAWGFSMGAYRAWQLAAEDARVAGCAASHWMTTAAAQGGYITSPSSYSMYRPSLYHDNTPAWDYPDIAIKIVPRPFLVQYGTEDKVISVQGAEVACIEIGTMYIYYNFAAHKSALAARKGSRAFQAKAYPVGHVFTKQHLTDLKQWLRECQKRR